MTKEEANETLEEYKIYKEKPYNNSNGDPFGVTLNGRVKDYINAHNKLREMVKKGRVLELEYKTDEKKEFKKGKIRFLSVVATKTILDTSIEVSSHEGSRGNVQMKSYVPSQTKKKGASTELRKLSGYDYSHVTVLKAMITNLLDTFIAGGAVSDVVKGSTIDLEVKELVYSCDLCNYKTKSQAGLKTHKTRIHKTEPKKCVSCEFVSFQEKELGDHTETCHVKKDDVRKRSAPSFQCEILSCGSTFVSEEKLMEHKQHQHLDLDQPKCENSPSSSPSRKKPVTDDNKENEDDDMEVVIEDKDVVTDSTAKMKVQEDIQSMLELRIKQLEQIIQNEKEEKEKMKVELNELKCKNTSESISVENLKKKPFKIPKHLKGVQNKHLEKLRGYKMRFCAIPDGACLTNCLTAHISCTEVEEERKINNMRVNQHIADNFENYYQNKITLPYIETVGVGANSKTVNLKTKEEFLAFLRSEESLCVFSNSQELFAIANMLNITVRIFSYGIGGDENRCEWKDISPDPDMAATAHFPKGWVPDMALYNSDQSHYDLLVEEDHRLALLGLVGTKTQNKTEKKTKDKHDANVDTAINEADDIQENVIHDGWKDVSYKKKKNPSPKPFIEEKLLDNGGDEYDDVDLEELDDEITLAKAKKSGHRRVDPSAPNESVSNEVKMFRCSWTNCKQQLESEGLLNAHMAEHSPEFYCNDCDGKFTCEVDLKLHRSVNHEDKEWNCESCSFQANSSNELMNHLKETGHQPSKKIQDPKSKITQCYTCKEEFASYWNLMNHRKQKHPSNRTCKYFLKKECVHGVNCWYRHDEPMETDPVVNQSRNSKANINCQICDKRFETVHSLRTHKMNEHSAPGVCQKFIQGDCMRSDEECWYKHIIIESKKESTPESMGQSGFRFTPVYPAPPDQTELIMKTLNMVLQKMELMERVFQQTQH